MPIPEKIRQQIRENKSIPIDLSDEAVSSADTEELVSLLNNSPNINEINLSRNNISNKGIEHLSYLKYIKNLNLSFNNFNDEGVSKLLDNTSFYNIDLSRNNLTDKTAEKIIKVDHQNRIINVSETKISSENKLKIQEINKKYSEIKHSGTEGKNSFSEKPLENNQNLFWNNKISDVNNASGENDSIDVEIKPSRKLSPAGSVEKT